MTVLVERSSSLRSQLQGKVLHLPNLEELVQRWPMAVNPLRDNLSRVIDDKLDEWQADDKVREKLKSVDLALFISS